MIYCFPIEFIRIALLQTLEKNHIARTNLFGGDNQINLFSFYEQVKSQAEVDRFTEMYRDLVEQQNRSNLIGNGVLLSPENPTITNLYSCLIIPMTWTCSIRTRLENRDQMLETINALIEELKGSKCDIAQLECKVDNKSIYVPFVVGTIGHNEGQPSINSGDYIGDNSSGLSIDTFVNNKVFDLIDKDILFNLTIDKDYLYYGEDNKIGVVMYKTKSYNYTPTLVAAPTTTGNQDGTTFTITQSDCKTVKRYVSLPTFTSGQCAYNFSFSGQSPQVINGTASINNSHLDDEGHWCFDLIWTFEDVQYPVTGYTHVGSSINYDTYAFEIITDGDDIIFPPEHVSFEKYKMSMSFDSLRCDEPRTLNGEEYCEISFGGSATIVNKSVMLGNDLVKVAISKNKIVAETPITLNGSSYYLEPLEMPSGNNANNVLSQLASNNFKQNTHTDGIGLVLQYSFILDTSVDLIKQWFNYARYGTYGTSNDDISPNMIYNVDEYWSSWGEVDKNQVLAKIVENITIENTESDTLTIGVNMQIQGENN